MRRPQADKSPTDPPANPTSNPRGLKTGLHKPITYLQNPAGKTTWLLLAPSPNSTTTAVTSPCRPCYTCTGNLGPRNRPQNRTDIKDSATKRTEDSTKHIWRRPLLLGTYSKTPYKKQRYNTKVYNPTQSNYPTCNRKRLTSKKPGTKL